MFIARFKFFWGALSVIASLSSAFAQGPTATPAEKLATLPGFKVELLHSATKEEGSWISMAIDPKGRLIISPQDDRNKLPLLRVTLTKQGQIEKIEKINQPVWTAMGLLYAFDSLYVSGNGANGLGLYRLKDTDGDDQYDSLEFLRKIDGAAGEHGSHALVVGPDKKIYWIHGNFVKLPGDLSPSSPHRNYADDLLLGRMEDGNGFGRGNKPPGCFVLRMDADAKNVELFAAGMRNAYDFDFNAEGEMFTFDSDMEWDWGTPWYRPIRVCHLVSGGDFGFREGTGKWPTYYPDSLPPVVDIGIGSLTGVKFGTKSGFPTKYKKALYIMDWSYGRIIAVHLTPKGASYSGAFENFVAPVSLKLTGPKATLNVTDMEFGQDGAMYFTTGGRNTQSGLYRVSYVGDESTNPTELADKIGAPARALRRRLEAFHGKRDLKAVDLAWPQLNSDDRSIRYAARIALESQPVEQWQQRALDERRANASVTALLALARCGNPSVQKELLDSLDRLDRDALNEAQKLEALRVLEVAFTRMGKPDTGVAKDTTERLDPFFPSRSESLNRELCQLLIYLEAPGAVQKTMRLLAQAQTQESQLYYVLGLRNMETGWTMDDRGAYFSWFHRNRSFDKHPVEVLQWFADVGQPYHDGASFKNFMANIRTNAAARLTDTERASLEPLIAGGAVPFKPTKERSLVKEWKTDDLLPALDQVSKGRSFERGKAAFNDAQCLACHRFGNEGGAVGPDLTGVASRYTRRDILDSILEPSKVLSDQYQNIIVTKKNGDDVTGRLLEENNRRLVLVTNPLTGEQVEVSRSDVQGRRASTVSPMPDGLVNILTRDEILDLIAYLESGGKANAPAFGATK
ncbi:MAG: heme-binding protein [Verrucomicrobia bacterium]|nr:MAG: heme-binding protein [Verrucomicrobiota bacterium]